MIANWLNLPLQKFVIPTVKSQFTEKRIDLQGYSTLYLEAGAATDSLPILFLHGAQGIKGSQTEIVKDRHHE